MSTALALCLRCGRQHAADAPCPEDGTRNNQETACACRHDHAAPAGAGHDCPGEHHHECEAEAGSRSCGCGHDHAPARAVDLRALGPGDATRAVYRIMNMDCPMEEALIRNKLAGMPGIDALEFHLMQRVLVVRHSLPSTAPIEEALRSIDMIPEALAAPDAAGPAPAAAVPWRKLGLAALLALGSEIAELCRDWGVVSPGLEDAALVLSALLALLAVMLGGSGVYKKGWIALRNRNLNMNALMSVAVTGALLIGHYPEAAMVMTLFNLSEALEARSLERARDAIRTLMTLAPETATVFRDGQWQSMPVAGVPVGSRVRVRPGERVALDGVVVGGRSAVDQSPITGESMPVAKNPGDAVYAGSINQAGELEFTSSALADDSTAARIIKSVEEAQAGRAPMQRLVDTFARFYTPAIFAVALLTALLPPLLFGGAWLEWSYTALVLLVIGCPCALVISTPVAIVSGMAVAARQGILVKGGLYLEQGRRLRCLALDKTGTVTHGRPCQTDFVPLRDLPHARSLAAGLAARSDHPVSGAIARQAALDGIEPAPVEDFVAHPGQGVSGVMEGRRWSLGNRRMAESVAPLSPEIARRVDELEAQGKSATLLMNDDGVCALIAVADTVRESGVAALKELAALGLRTVMLTGDNAHAARAVARQAGIDEVRADLLPEDKLHAVEELAARGPVGMVGDGINDAPALARAHIGFAMAAAGTDTAMETADVALMDDDLRKIPRFIRLSRAVHAILIQNIVAALGVKALFLALTFMGFGTMWMAVFADVGASLLVIANSLRVLRFQTRD